jgi:hypothetical protein
MWHHKNGAHQKERVRKANEPKDPRKYIETRHIAGGPEPGRRDHLCVPSAGGRRYSFPFRFKTGSARLIGASLWLSNVRGGARWVGAGWTL